MSSMKNIILYFIVFNTLVQIQSIVELPAKEDSVIVSTELAVRNTINSIFSILNLTRVQNKARFTEFAAIHNFFVTITLQDHENLKEIESLARVDNIDNDTQHFITQLNEVLNEDNKSYEETDDVYVTTHIKTFIRKLEYLKYKYGFTDNAASLGINKEVLQHLKGGDNFTYVTKAAEETNDLHGNILNDNEFWKSSGRRIYMGQKVKIKRFPFMASVHFFKKFQCGGSIIKSDLVITSASCLQLAYNNRFFRENPAFLSVQVGCDLYEGGDEEIPVIEVYFHPEYNPKNLRNNLAIMRLVRYIRFGKRVTKVKKIDIDREPSPLPVNVAITVVGWGARKSDNIIKDIWSNPLSSAELDFYPLKECQEIYSKEYVTYKNFCAGFFSKGGGACNVSERNNTKRDVGGPGVVRGILVGVISFGSPVCGAPDSPTVFTKLGYYSDWIEGVMEMKPIIGKAKTTVRTTRVPLDFQHYMDTTHHFTLTPVTESEENTTQHITLPAETENEITVVPEIVIPETVEPETVDTETVEPEIGESTSKPDQSIDALRAPYENHRFKEFIKTMFGAEDVKEYLDQYEYETDKSAAGNDKSGASVKKIVKENIKPATKGIDTESEDSEQYAGPLRMVTALDKFQLKEDSSTEAEIERSLEGRTTTYFDSSKEEEKKVEQNIAQLINDIDIQELLASDFSASSSDSERVNKPMGEKSNSLSKKNDIKMTIESESEDDTLLSSSSLPVSDDDKDSGDRFMNLLDLTKNKMDDQQEGLSIPAESFQDFTFRQNQTASSILDIFTENDLIRLLTEAVVEAAKSKQYKK